MSAAKTTTERPVRFECGCSLIGGGWENGNPGLAIPTSAPSLCVNHADDLIAVLTMNARTVRYHNSKGERLIVVAEPIAVKP